MKLSEEKLKEIEGFASLFYSIKDIAIILELKENELMLDYRNKESDVYKRYMKGFLTTEGAIRKSEIGLAKRGSTPAQESIKKYISNARVDNK